MRASYMRRDRPRTLRARQTRDQRNLRSVTIGNLEVKKGERDSLRRLLLERIRRGRSVSDINFSLELPGSPRIT
ncbi:hypothetical protein TNCV_4762401 [Trichonephila clavipes]|nr:hypothetical protein TNCV_4762401 [Trichonephila clavipes]